MSPKAEFSEDRDSLLMEAKCRQLSVYALGADYHAALAGWEGSPAEQKILEAFEERLRLEATRISRAPELLFPHFYNHLIWLDAPDSPLHALCEQARAGRPNWLRMVQDPQLALPPQPFVLKGHTGQVTSLAVSLDLTTLVSGSKDQTVKVWDLLGRQMIRSLAGQPDVITSVALSPDGATLVSGGRDGTLRVWELHSWRLIRSLAGQRYEVTSLAVSPDGTTVVSGGRDGMLRVWELRSGRLIHSLASHRCGVTSVAVSPDGATLVAGSKDEELFSVWDLRVAPH